MIPYIYTKLRENASETLVSAYTGGASLELALLDAGVIKNLILNDLDFGVYAVYWSIKHAPEHLQYLIQTITPSHRDYFLAQEIVKSDYEKCTIIEAAWSCLLVNRLAYSGIFSANPLGGRKGSKDKLLSRWNPDELCKRIGKVHKLSEHITIHNKDACELIEEEYWRPNTTIFLDPPYVKKGKQLYRYYYDLEEHMRLSFLLDTLHQGMPGADIILTYDDDPLIKNIYEFPTIEKCGRVYTI